MKTNKKLKTLLGLSIASFLVAGGTIATIATTSCGNKKDPNKLPVYKDINTLDGKTNLGHIDRTGTEINNTDVLIEIFQEQNVNNNINNLFLASSGKVMNITKTSATISIIIGDSQTSGYIGAARLDINFDISFIDPVDPITPPEPPHKIDIGNPTEFKGNVNLGTIDYDKSKPESEFYNRAIDKFKEVNGLKIENGNDFNVNIDYMDHNFKKGHMQVISTNPESVYQGQYTFSPIGNENPIYDKIKGTINLEVSDFNNIDAADGRQGFEKNIKGTYKAENKHVYDDISAYIVYKGIFESVTTHKIIDSIRLRIFINYEGKTCAEGMGKFLPNEDDEYNVTFEKHVDSKIGIDGNDQSEYTHFDFLEPSHIEVGHSKKDLMLNLPSLEGIQYQDWKNGISRKIDKNNGSYTDHSTMSPSSLVDAYLVYNVTFEESESHMLAETTATIDILKDDFYNLHNKFNIDPVDLAGVSGTFNTDFKITGKLNKEASGINTSNKGNVINECSVLNNLPENIHMERSEFSFIITKEQLDNHSRSQGASGFIFQNIDYKGEDVQYQDGDDIQLTFQAEVHVGMTSSTVTFEIHLVQINGTVTSQVRVSDPGIQQTVAPGATLHFDDMRQTSKSIMGRDQQISKDIDVTEQISREATLTK